MANTYDVPVTLPDGRQFLVPVEDVETPEEAARFVQEQMDAGNIQFPDVTGDAPQPNEPVAENRLRGGTSQEEAQVARELLSGLEQTALNTGIFVLKGLRSAAPAIVPKPLQGDFLAGTYRAEEALKRKKAEEEFAVARTFAEQYGEEPSDFVIGIGQELPFIPLAFIPGMQGSTLARAAGWNALQGLFAGGIAQADGDTLEGMALGAALGAGATYAFGVLPGARAFLGRYWAKQSDTAEAKARLALEAKIRQETGNPEFGFSIAEIAQENPFLVSLGRSSKAANQAALQRSKDNLSILVDSIERRAGSIQDRGKLATELADLMVDTSRRMHGTARRNYQAGMDVLLEKYGDDIIIDGRQYLDDLERLLVDDMGVGAGRVPAAVRQHIEKVDLTVNPAIHRQVEGGLYRVTDRRTGKVLGDFKTPDVATRFTETYNKYHGGLTTEQVVAIVKSHNALIAGEKNVFDVADPGSNDWLGKYLKSSLLGSMRGSTSDAVNLMNRINNAYAYDMQMVRELRNSHLGKIFGGDPTQMTPQQQLEILLGEGTDRASLQATRRVLQQEAPDLLYDLQRQQVREVLTQGRSGAFSSADLEADINLLMTALSGKGDKSNVGKIGMGLFSPAEQQHMIDAAKALSTIRTLYMKTGQADVGAANLASDVAINVISRSQEFVARLITRVFMRGSTVADLMTDPVSREYLIQLAKNGPNSPAFKMAATGLATWTGQVQAAEDRERERAEAEQAGAENPGGA